jgi:hypothetical protein
MKHWVVVGECKWKGETGQVWRRADEGMMQFVTEMFVSNRLAHGPQRREHSMQKH